LRFDYYKLAIDLWYLLGAIWLLGMLTATKTTARRQSAGSRISQSALTLLGLYLVFIRNHIAWMNPQFLTPSDATGVLGLAITLLGVAFAVWARVTLGKNWSGTVTLKQDHTLVRRGPYRIVRHPIYTGFLLAALGVAVITGEVRGLVGAAILFVAFRVKSLTEESFMLANFGEQYVEYKREVKALIPWVF
jgi:protein-S-isoprenylcysteine O-methyltransferase Ste14